MSMGRYCWKEKKNKTKNQPKNPETNQYRGSGASGSRETWLGLSCIQKRWSGSDDETFCVTETAHRVASFVWSTCRWHMRRGGKTRHRGELPLLPDFFNSGSEAIWLLKPRTSCLADVRPLLLSRLKLFKLRLSGLAVSSSMSELWHGHLLSCKGGNLKRSWGPKQSWWQH